VTKLARVAAALALTLALAGCLSPAASLVLSLIPDGTLGTVLNNMKGVSEPNREKLAALEQKGDWQGIVQFAQENIAVDPTNSDWRVVAGMAYVQLKQYERAADQFQRAVQLSPDDITAWNLLAQTYRAMGQPERAIRTLDSALRINQDSPVSYFLLGESFRDLKRPERAVGFYEQALQRNPQFPEAVFGAGVAYAQLGRRMEWEIAVQRLRKMNPALAEQLASIPPQSAPTTAGGIPSLPTERLSPR
jgi:tetratricopeptide (TPR) repeat protein